MPRKGAKAAAAEGAAPENEDPNQPPAGNVDEIKPKAAKAKKAKAESPAPAAVENGKRKFRQHEVLSTEEFNELSEEERIAFRQAEGVHCVSRPKSKK